MLSTVLNSSRYRFNIQQRRMKPHVATSTIMIASIKQVKLLSKKYEDQLFYDCSQALDQTI